MNGIQQSRSRNLENSVPGCLGRMVNLFDLSANVAGNRLLADKPHRDGSPLSRSRSDVTRMSSPEGDAIEDKMIVSELRRTSSNRKSNGTPMKMLIAEEMSKDMESKHKSPNVVAKLMGLDALPEQPDPATMRSHSKSYSWNHSGLPLGDWQQELNFSDKQMQLEDHRYEEQYKYKDVYEIWEQSRHPNYGKNKMLQRSRYNEPSNEKKMALVRQKFIEAKRLATDEKLRQSSEFQDALEVLSSNRDLFLKFLQEPSSLFSQHLHELHAVPPLPETKRITVLKPSKVLDKPGSGKKGEKHSKKQTQSGQVNSWDQREHRLSPSFVDQEVDENTKQPTRIVVLKPSPGKTHDIKVMVSPASSSPRRLQDDDFYGEPEDEEARESREVAKEITKQMRENLSGHRRDETLLSSVFSNGYVGDESSFNKSESEYILENLSDSEVVTPTSRHSWDYINRFGSPFSSSSFSRASYSPESSVCREAKKRLSERWAMMASTRTCQDQRQLRRSSSTLGEMLALSDIKKSIRTEEEDANKEQDPTGSTSCTTGNLNKENSVEDSPRNLVRSKSVPVSSTANYSMVNVEVPDLDDGGTVVSKEVMKTSRGKSSFKGKVSSLFFPKNKKMNKEKSSPSISKSEAQSSINETQPVYTGKTGDDISQCVSNASSCEVGFSTGITSSPGPVIMGPSQGIISSKVGLSVANPAKLGYPGESQDQPSPISVLEPPFEDDNAALGSCRTIKPDPNGNQFSVNSIKSNLIDKSPPIESVARTLSWDDSCSHTATLYPLKPPSLVVPRAEEDEQKWYFLLQTLISAAGLDDKVQPNSFFAKCHSADSPLNPLLREKYIDLSDKEPMHESKRRQVRSCRKLVFDCVNTELVDILGHVSDSGPWPQIFGRAQDGILESSALTDRVWARMREWFSGQVRFVGELGEGGDRDSLLVESLVRKEVVGKEWGYSMKSEADNARKEIEGKLLQELVEEAVVELTDRMCC